MKKVILVLFSVLILLGSAGMAIGTTTDQIDQKETNENIMQAQHRPAHPVYRPPPPPVRHPSHNYPRYHSPGAHFNQCFIATAVYGSDHSYVTILRKFRDRWLLISQPGQSLVNFYYNHSPRIAEFIQQHSFLKMATKIVLLPAVGISYCLNNIADAIFISENDEKK